MEQKYVERFWAHVSNTGSCWLWTGGNGGKKKYGKFHVWPRTLNAHRVSWELAHGEIPVGLCVLHRCDVPLCVNPSHLFLGTKAENNADMKAKGRNRYKLPAPATGDAHPLYRQPMKAPRRKLTWDAVESIRVAHISGDSTQSIAERYGITREQVNNIVSERQWKVSV